MPRIRSIHPDACDSDKLSSLTDSAERTFFRLLTHTDDEGRGHDRPKLIAAKLYPLHDGKDAVTVTADFDDLERVGLLVRYTVAGKCYYVIPTFTDWQNPRHPTASKLPSPDESDVNDTARQHNDTEDDSKPTAVRGNAPEEDDKAPAGVGVEVGVGGGVERPSDESDRAGDEFDQFWEQYPRGQAGKPGGDGARKPALTRFRRLTDGERAACLRAVPHYAEHIANPDGPHAAHAITWLNQERWEVWQEPAESPVGRLGTGGVPASSVVPW